MRKPRIETVTPEEAENVDVMVCCWLTEPLLMADNLIDACAGCGIQIQLAPSSPKKPMRLCPSCAKNWIRPQ